MTEDGQPVIYKSRRLKLAPAMGMLMAVCFAVLALATPSPSVPVLRWLPLAMACPIFAVSVYQQIMLGFTSIQISSKGIEIRYWRFSTVHFEWSDIVEFFPDRLLGHDYVAFTLSPAYHEKMRRQRYAGSHKGMLPDTYGFTAEALAKLLNAERKSALRK